MRLGNAMGIPLTGVEIRTLWGPPMLGESGGATPIAFLLLSSGLIMMLPKISESIESFMAGKGIQGTGIGEALGPFGTLGKTVAGEASGSVTRWGAGRLGGGATTADAKASGLTSIIENMEKQARRIQNFMLGLYEHEIASINLVLAGKEIKLLSHQNLFF